MDELHPTLHPGRGALSNPTGRFEPFAVVAFDDGWTPEDGDPPRLETRVHLEHTRQAITRNDSPDVPFEQSLNPYRGCEHGCAYCFARPSHAYLGLSPGLDFESRLVARPEAPARLREELARRSYRCRPLALGTNTDPYQPLERELRITRGVLDVLHEARHPVSITTKSHLVTRDLDLLAPMAKDHLAMVCVSITTLDRQLARRLEPRAAAPERRLDTVRELAAAGVPVSVLFAPLIPAINDAELERVLEAAREAGARSAGWVLLRLPLELKRLFSEWLEQHFPERAAHVLALVRELRDGQLYRARFGERMSGTGPVAELLAVRFRAAAARLGLGGRELRLDTSQFRAPARPSPQLDLFRSPR
jgi:DNA repair photolyase